MANREEATCSQCGKPPLLAVSGTLLCLDCAQKWDDIVSAQIERQANLLNVLAGFAEMHTGFPMPRLQMSRARRGPITLNNIHVANSVVGSINTGEIGKLDLVMSHMRVAGQKELANALQEFTQAVIDSQELSAGDKNSALEHLSFLAGQSTLPAEERQSAVAKAVIPNLERTITRAGAIASLWSALKPLLETLF